MLLTYLNYYLLVGITWLLIHELTGYKMNNGMRFRLFAFWPVTMGAWIIGFIDAWRNYNDEE